MWGKSHHLGKAAAVARMVLSNPTSVVLSNPTNVHGVSGFTGIWLQQWQEWCYPILPMYMVFLGLQGYGCSSGKNGAIQSYQCTWCFWVYRDMAAAVGRIVLSNPTNVHGVSGFTGIWLQQWEEWCYPILPMYMVFLGLQGYGYSSGKNSTVKTYQWMQSLNVTWIWLLQWQKQHYPFLPD